MGRRRTLDPAEMGPSSPAVPRSAVAANNAKLEYRVNEAYSAEYGIPNLPGAPIVSADTASFVVQGRSRRECWTAQTGSSSAFRRSREVELLPQPGPHRARPVAAPAGPRFRNDLNNGNML